MVPPEILTVARERGAHIVKSDQLIPRWALRKEKVRGRRDRNHNFPRRRKSCNKVSSGFWFPLATSQPSRMGVNVYRDLLFSHSTWNLSKTVLQPFVRQTQGCYLIPALTTASSSLFGSHLGGEGRLACGRGSVTMRRMGTTRKLTGCLCVLVSMFAIGYRRFQNKSYLSPTKIAATWIQNHILLSVLVYFESCVMSCLPLLSSLPFRIMSHLYLAFSMAAINWHWVLIGSSGGEKFL